MEQNIWPKLEGLNMNTLIVPLYWEIIEPVEEQYSYEVLDGIIQQAREHNKRLIFLWFGLWKNAESMYVPGWMKQDTTTYFRAEKINGERLNTISPFCEVAIEKDARAFKKIMAHIREVDEEQSTVIMMQVENEVGLLGTAADYCEEARKAFAQDVPECLVENQKKGTWKEVFEDDAEEIFMSYYFARALEKIAKAGYEEYPIPYFANAWLKQYPWYPGSYPSGGPVKSMHKIWKYVAPSLCALAPDIYVPYVAEIMEEWEYESNPLIIPEVRKDVVTASYALYALTHHHALCYSPFGIEDLGMRQDELLVPPPEMMAALNIDPEAFNIQGTKEVLGSVYSLFQQMIPLYLKYRGTSHMRSFLKKSEEDRGIYLRFKEVDLEISYFPKTPGCPIASGVVYEVTDTSFIIVGMMGQVTFHAKAGENAKVEFLRKEVGTIQDGSWIPYQKLNGDEKGYTIMGNQPTCFYVELYKY